MRHKVSSQLSMPRLRRLMYFPKRNYFIFVICLALLLIFLARNRSDNNKKLLTQTEVIKNSELFVKNVKPSAIESNWTMLDIRRLDRDANLHYQVLDQTPLHPTQWQNFDHIHPSPTNVTTNTNVLFYNRVPKCGSTTIQDLLRKLARQNDFIFYSSKIYWEKVLSTKDEEDLVSFLSFRQRKPIAFDQHFYTLDWAKHGIQTTLFNMVREPVDRIISEFYYLRSAERWARKKDQPPQSWFDKNFDSCILSLDPECIVGGGEGQEMQITYFCGSQAECSNATSWEALQMAKYNVEKRYSVVGVVERMNTSLAVMEKYLPRWFSGARRLLSLQKKNTNTHAGVSEKVKELLRKALYNEIEFYNFINQRLSLQLN